MLETSHSWHGNQGHGRLRSKCSLHCETSRASSSMLVLPSHGDTHDIRATSGLKHTQHPWPLLPLKLAKDPFSQGEALEAELADWEALRRAREPSYMGFLYESSPLLLHTGRTRAVCLSVYFAQHAQKGCWHGHQSDEAGTQGLTDLAGPSGK